MVVLFWTTSLINNRALEYDISIALHIILKSSSLLVNMVVGRVLLRKRYSTSQVASVFMVTIGVVLASFYSATSSSTAVESSMVGIGLLCIALILSSALGLYQEQIYVKYGKNSWKEGLFYTVHIELR